MKRTILALGCAAALGFATNAYARQPETDRAIEIIIDDSGVLQHPEDARPYVMSILSQVKRLSRRRDGAYVQIDVISTSYGRTVWTGTPHDLRRNPARAQALVDNTEASGTRCNNLPGAFAELQSNLAALERQGRKRIDVFVFSSLIHTPRPCSETTQIALPQLPPSEGDFNGALMGSSAVRSISFYWVSPHQKGVWEQHLNPVFQWAATSGIDIRFFDEVRSKSALLHGVSALEERP